jgi:ATP-dependent helicase/nuclease subunit A
VIRDLAALTRALDHLGDRTAWLAILRAPWCGLTLRDLTALVSDAPRATVWECIESEERVARLNSDACTRLQRVREVLETALSHRDRRDLAHWVETTWLRLGGPAVCANDEDLDHARAFFNALARWSSEPDWAGPLSLNELLSELYAVHTAAPADAVQIMTIHRAKGLEFDKVIVPGLGRRLRGNAEPLLRWLELPREPEGSDLLMAAIPHAARRGLEPLNEYLKSLQSRRAMHERARLLYVAATRARTELHLFAELPEAESPDSEVRPASGTLLAALWPAIALQFPNEIDAAAKSIVNVSSRSQTPLFERLTTQWRMPDVPAGPRSSAIPIASYEAEEEADSTWTTDPDRCVARVVREQLFRFARHDAQPNAALLQERFTRIGLADEDLAHCAARAEAILTACLADSRFLWMFARANRNVLSPLQLTGLYEGRLTSVSIDYSFIDPNGTRWLIEFSLEMPSTADVDAFIDSELARRRPQLRKYAALAQHLGSEPVRVAMYFPFAQAFAEDRA